MYFTPLRYPGGKSKLAAYIKLLFEENNLLDGHYVEPYAGGSGVAMELLLQEYARNIHINDIDPAIHAFWHSVLNETDDLCRKIRDTKISIHNWKIQKNILNNPNNHSLLALGFATFFLNRTNRSGILKAGVIGGKEQSGKWKMDVRFNREDLISRIEIIASYAARISLYKLDATDFLKYISTNLPEDKTLVYLDPPYYVKGKGLYRNYYNHNDHVEIEKHLQKMNSFKWIVSYDNVEEIKQIYSNYDQVEYSLSYTAQNKKLGSEVMIYSPKIIYPRNKLPRERAA